MTKIPSVNLSTTLNTFRTRFNRLIDSVGDIATLTTDGNTTVVEAINTIDSNLGTRTSLTTNDKTTFVASINELDSDIGDITTLTTSSTGDIVIAINSLVSDKLDSASTQSMIDSNFTDSNRIGTIPANVLTNNQLANNAITVNGVEIALGASGNIDITDSGTSVALIKSTLRADSNSGIHYDSATATFSLDKIPNSSLGNVTYTINGVTGTLGEPITIEAIDSGATDGILDSAFADMTRDIVSRQPEFSITTNQGKIALNTANEIVEFNEDTGTDTHISIGTPAGTGNTAAGRPTNSGVVEANKHLLLISDSAEIVANKIELITTPDATGNDINILSGGGVNIDLAYPYDGLLTIKENGSTKYQFNPSGTYGPTFEIDGTGVVRANPSGTGTSGSLLVEAEKDLVFTSNRDNTYNPNSYGQFSFSNANNSNQIKIDTRYDSNSIKSDEPLSIVTTETGESISFKSGSGQYNFFDSDNKNYNTFTVDSAQFKITSNVNQNLVDSIGENGTRIFNLADPGVNFHYSDGSGNYIADLTVSTGAGMNRSFYAIDNNDWYIRTGFYDDVTTNAQQSLYLGGTNVGLRHVEGGKVQLWDSEEYYGTISYSSDSSAMKVSARTSKELHITSPTNIKLDAEENIRLDPYTGYIYLDRSNAERGAFDLAFQDQIRLYTYVTATSSYALNTTWEDDNLTVQGDITTLSDERTKENIQTVNGGLDIVDTLRGVWYNKKDDPVRRVGVIAQEVEQVLPEVVHTSQDGMKSVDYGKMVGVLIEAIKDLKNEVDELKVKLGD